MSMPAEQEQVMPIYDLDMARDFFRMIERDGSFMLQTFDDVPKGVKGDPGLAANILWPAGDPAGQQRAWNKILSLYARGAGVSSPSIELTAQDASGRISPASVAHGARTIMDAQLSYRFSHR